MLDLENINSPCLECYNRGHLYSSDNKYCQKCEYNISIYALKQILIKDDNYCQYCCNNIMNDSGEYTCCFKNKYDNFSCIPEQFLKINWNYIFKKYGEPKK
jgi:hypothetical protein